MCRRWSWHISNRCRQLSDRQSRAATSALLTAFCYVQRRPVPSCCPDAIQSVPDSVVPGLSGPQRHGPLSQRGNLYNTVFETYESIRLQRIASQRCHIAEAKRPVWPLAIRILGLVSINLTAAVVDPFFCGLDFRHTRRQQSRVQRQTRPRRHFMA